MRVHVPGITPVQRKMKRRISASEVMRDIRRGLSAFELMREYRSKPSSSPKRNSIVERHCMPPDPWDDRFEP